MSPETTVTTDKTSYTSGDIIYFSGTVMTSDSSYVTVVINDPNNKFVLLTSGIADSNHRFQIMVDTGSQDNKPKFSLEGIYNATAFITNQAAGKTTSFVFSPVGSPPVPSPTPPITPPPTPVPQPTQNNTGTTQTTDAQAIYEEIQKRIEDAKRSQQSMQEKPTTILNATTQELASINEARNNQTIAAEVNVVNQTVQTTSNNSNVSVQTNNTSPDSLSISVSAPSQTGPKVLVVNLAAATINVANLKDLGVMYDGASIPPASNIDSILNAKSTDSPSFAIVVTQSGAQILILIPHFSTHTITITNMSKVIPAVSEFGSLAGMIIITSMIGILTISRKFKFHF